MGFFSSSIIEILPTYIGIFPETLHTSFLPYPVFLFSKVCVCFSCLSHIWLYLQVTTEIRGLEMFNKR